MATAAPKHAHIDADRFLSAGRVFIDRSTDVKSTIESLLRQAASISGSERASLYLLDKANGVLRPFVLLNIPENYLAGCAEVPLGTQCCGRAALHAHPWVVEDMWTDPLFADCRDAAINSGMRSGYSIPVLDDQGAVLGSLGFQFQETHRPDAQELERGAWFARLIAYALARTTNSASV